jgi:hypothetical protein
MLQRSLAFTFLLFLACGGDKTSTYELRSNPVSVRGWIVDVAGAKRGETMEMEIARRTELFASTSLWVEEFQYASGGISGNGAFMVLDVPPQTATIGFNAPGAETARLVLQNIPGNADVFIPDVVLEPGGAKVLDPKKILVRVPASVSKATPTGRTAIVAGYTVPIIDTPMHELRDRRDYPSPGGFRPVATVK